MIALMEAVTRSFSLRCGIRARETVKVSSRGDSGDDGNNGRTCTIYGASHRATQYKYWLENGQVQLLDYATERVTPLSLGDERTIGAMKILVCGSGEAERSTAGPPRVPPGVPRRPAITAPPPPRPAAETPSPLLRQLAPHAPPPAPPPPPRKS